MSIFTGSGVAIVTPFNADHSVDFTAYEKLVDFHLSNGTDAIVVCGTTGESATLTDEENTKLVKTTVEMVHKKVPVIAGVGSNNTAHAIHLSKEAQKVGADALLHVTPYYNKATQKGLVCHFSEIAQNTNLPIILYSVSIRTSTNIMPSTVLELSKVPNIVAIKEASGNISQIAQIASLIPSDFDIYSGNDDQIVPVLSLGGKGVISVVANIVPKMIHDLVAAYLAGDTKTALTLQLKILALNDAMFCELSPIPVKEALAMMGMCKNVFRSPMCELEDKSKELVGATLKTYGLL